MMVQDDLYVCLEDRQLENLEPVLKRLFSGIPYNAYIKNTIAEYEGFYISVIFAYFYSLGIDIILEDTVSKCTFGSVRLGLFKCFTKAYLFSQDDFMEIFIWLVNLQQMVDRSQFIQDGLLSAVRCYSYRSNLYW